MQYLRKSVLGNNLILRHCIAILATLVAFACRLVIEAHLGHELPTYITFYPAVIVSALLGGYWAGLLSTGLAALITAYWILPPQGSLRIENEADSFALVLFAALGIFVSIVAELYRRERQKSAAYEREKELLEHREALRHSQERYGALVELSPVAIIVNRNNRIEFANPAACELLGAVTPQQLYGKPVLDVFHPDFHATVEERIKMLFRGEQLPVIEQKIVRLDGAIREAEVVSSTFTDRDGTAIQVIVRDITERKQKEQQLEKLSRTLKALNESNEALLHATDEASLLQQICAIITRDCGHAMVWIGFAENDELKTVRPVAHAGFEDGYLESLRITWSDTPRGRGPTGTAIRTGKFSICRNMLTAHEFKPWREEARKRGYASSLAVPLIGDGRSFGSITIYSREPDSFSPDEIRLLEELAADLSFGISALRLRAEHERVGQALRESEERLRVAADAGSIGMWNWNPKAGTVMVSANWKNIFGIDPDVNVTFETWRNALHPDDRERAMNALLAAQEHHTEYNIEYRAVWPSGEVRWIVDRGRAAYASDGTAISMAGVNVDVTERKRAEAALLQSEKLASVGRMAATIAHEINNPLAAVMNTLFIAQMDPELPDSVRHHLEVADEELRRVSHITHQALGFYREASVASTVSVSAVLDSAVDVLQSRIKAKQATIDRQYDGKLEIRAVSGELRQVFCNLLSNSLDALAVGGRIVVRASEGRATADGKPTVRVTLADNGKGITPASRPHIFEALYTTKDETGTGLGLWVAKQLLQKHGGSIRFRTRDIGNNTGTVFSIQLPAHAEQPRAMAAVAAASSD